jgi:hypothetical protein
MRSRMRWSTTHSLSCITGETWEKFVLSASRARDDHGPMLLRTVPVQLNARIDCPNCGRIDKLNREFNLPESEANPRIEKIAGPCERCASPAHVVFERTVLSIH